MIATVRQRNFALLLFGGLISDTGDWLLMIGLPVYVYVLTGSALATSITLITGFIPVLLLSSLAGVFVDRWDRRWTMIISNLLLALGLLPLLAVHSRESLWIVFAVQFVESCIAQFVQPAESALLPNLVSEEQIVPANALKSVSTNTARLVGAALGGLLVGIIGLAGVTLLDAVSFLFVSAMIGLISMPARPKLASEAITPAATQVGSGHIGREWLEGIHLIIRSRVLTVILIIFAAMGLGEGVFSMLLIVFVKKVLGGGAIEYGLLLSVQAIGSLVGGLVIAQIGNRIAPARLFGICLFAFGFIDLLIVNIPAFIPGLLIVLILFVIVGLPGTGMIVSLNALLQISVDDRLRGRVFGTCFAVFGLMILIGMSLAGILGDRLGPVLLLNMQGGMHVFAGIFALLMLGTVKAQAHQEEDKVGCAHQPPIESRL